MSKLTFSELETLWIQEGGSSLAAPMAAAISLAESGGCTNCPPSNTNDWGPWQEHNGGPSMYDPVTAARTAIAHSKNGTDWHPWCSAWSDHACGTKGGVYLGPGAPFYQFLPHGMGTTVGTDQTILNQTPGTTPSTTTASSSNDCLIQIPSGLPSWIPLFGSGRTPCLFPKSWGKALLGGVAILGGAVVLAIGLVLLLSESQTVKQAVKLVGMAAA